MCKFEEEIEEREEVEGRWEKLEMGEERVRNAIAVLSIVCNVYSTLTDSIKICFPSLPAYTTIISPHSTL